MNIGDDGFTRSVGPPIGKNHGAGIRSRYRGWGVVCGNRVLRVLSLGYPDGGYDGWTLCRPVWSLSPFGEPEITDRHRPEGASKENGLLLSRKL